MDQQQFVVPLLVCLVAVSVFVCVHVESPGDIYRYRSMDYENMIPVIYTYLYPEYFSGHSIFGPLNRFDLAASPIYYAIFAIPISTLFHPVTGLKILGYLVSITLFLVTAYPYRNTGDWLRGFLVLIYFLHVGHWANPIFGTRKSFAVLLLAGGLVSEIHDYRVGRYLFLALAIGIYPMSGLVLLGFFILRRTAELNNRSQSMGEIVWESGVYIVLAAAVLTPFLMTKLFPMPVPATPFRTLNYNLNSLSGFIDTFIVGYGPGSRGALFRRDWLLIYSLVAVLLCGLSYGLARKRRWQWRPEYGWLLCSGIVFWGLAHLFYPLIYQPTKYTKTLPALVSMFLVADNTRAIRDGINNKLNRESTWWLSIGVFGTGLGLYLVGWQIPTNWNLVIHEHTPFRMVIRLVLALGITVGIMAFLSCLGVRNSVSLALPICLLIVFYPHPTWLDQVRSVERQPPEVFTGAFEIMRASEEGTRFVAPKSISVAFPIYAMRPPFFRQRESDPEETFRRADRFYDIYCGKSLEKMLAYMSENDIQFLVVSQRWFTNGWCEKYTGHTPPKTGGLDRSFDHYRWHSNGYFLLTDDDLRRELSNT